jgi:FKBP-type peptidyl-prolyl cis-trans isomerase (trigger factor)
VKIGLILSEIADKEKLSVTPEELEIRTQILRGQYQDPGMQAELDKPESRRDIEARLLTEKTLTKLTDYSK